MLTSIDSMAFDQLPSGWRLPYKRELADDIRNKSPSKFATVEADFNDDGVVDKVMILKSLRFSGEALWIHLSEGHSKYTWVKLSEFKWGIEYPNVDIAMGVDIVAPGVIPYACFDDAKECNFGPYNERPKLKLASPSIEYFKPESAASLFFWSKKHKRFLQVWLSD